MFAQLLRMELDRRWTVGWVTSAGTRARPDCPPDPETAAVMNELGQDIGAHRSQVITAEAVSESDLIVCMELDHLMDVVGKQPAAFERTFLVRELAGLAAEHSSEAGPTNGQELRAWAARLGRGRSVEQLVRTGRSLDIADPYGRGTDRIRATADFLRLAADTITSTWPTV